MHSFVLALLLLSSTINSKDPVLNKDDETITHLTHSNFQRYLNHHKYVVVNFFTDNCAACDTFWPLYKKLAHRLKKENIKFTSVNLTKEPKLSKRVKGLVRPVVKLYIYGVHVIYSGELIEDSLFNFFIVKTHNHTEELYDEEDIEDFMNRKRSLIYFLPQEDEKSLEVFEALSGAYTHIPFRYSYDENIKEKHGKGKHVMVFFRDFNEGHKTITFDDHLTPELLKSFVESHQRHFVIDMDKSLDHHILGPDAAAMVYFGIDYSEPEFQIYEHFAKSKRHTFSFMKSLLTESIGSHVAHTVGVTKEQLPVVLILYGDAENFKRVDVGEITHESMAKAIASFKASGIINYTKSQHVVDNTDKIVKIVVAENFDELVIENNKVVLLNVYSPWCATCREYMKVVDELGDLMKDQNDIIIAKIDGTLNEHRLMEVNTHPSFLLFVPGAKEHPEHHLGAQKIHFLVKELEKAVGRDLPQPPFKEEDDGITTDL